MKCGFLSAKIFWPVQLYFALDYRCSNYITDNLTSNWGLRRDAFKKLNFFCKRVRSLFYFFILFTFF